MEEGKVYKTTKNNFKFFEVEVNYWISYFGLLGWDIEILHLYPDNTATCGWFSCENLHDRCGSIVLSKQMNVEPINEVLSQIAFHEVMELFFSRIFFIAAARNFSIQDLTEENHNLIRILENTVFKELYKNRFEME